MTGISTLSASLKSINLLTDQQTLLNSLTTQLASGKKTQNLSGLDNDILLVQRSRTSIKTLDGYLNNITHADRRLELMLNSIEEFQVQAQNLVDFMVDFSQESAHQEGTLIEFDDPATTNITETIPLGYDSAEPDADFSNMIKFANNIFGVYQDLLNAQDGSRYLFSGAETKTKPIADSSALDAAVSALVGDWKDGSITTDDFIADLTENTTANGNNDAITDTIVGYSSALSANTARDVFVRVDDKTEIDFTVLANNKAFRDVIVAASYLKSENLPPIADHIDPTTLTVITEGAPGADADESKENFFAVFRQLTASVNSAIDEMDEIRFQLENVRSRIDQVKEFHTSEKNLLINTVSDVENVDLNEVALSINTLSIQLDASYRVTARSAQLSLVNFI